MKNPRMVEVRGWKFGKVLALNNQNDADDGHDYHAQFNTDVQSTRGFPNQGEEPKDDTGNENVVM